MSNATNAGSSVERTISMRGSVPGMPSCSSIVDIPISDLLPSDSPPRTAGVSVRHIRLLAESVTALPPIVVDRRTMQVVDGWHRLCAAQLRGDTTIAAAFFDGDPAEAFVLAVKLNSAHGLPLSLADRKSAALRILLSYPDWSDRSIAAIAGVSHRTVAAVRSRSTGQIAQSTSRIASNGVVHRSGWREGRQRAAELFAADPTVSARKVALAAGISVTTAKDVRKRLREGRQPTSSPKPATKMAAAPEPALDDARNLLVAVPQGIDAGETLHRLRKDPSLRFTETGRKLLRLLDTPFGDRVDWSSVARSLPDHCSRSIAQVARRRSQEWQQLADLLDQRQ